MKKKTEQTGAVEQKLNYSELIRDVLKGNLEASTQEVAEILKKKMPDHGGLAVYVTTSSFQSSVSGIRSKLKNGGQTAGVRTAKRAAVPHGKPTTEDLIKFLDATSELKIDVAKLADTLKLVEAMGGSARVLAMATTLSGLKNTLKTDEQIKAVLTTLHGLPL